MNTPGFLAVMLGVVALFIYLGILSNRAEQRRLAALADLCRRRGWSFDPARDAAMEARLPDLACLRQGDERYAENILSGPVAARDGSTRRCTAFDYHFTTESVDAKGNRQTEEHAFSVLVLECDLPLQPLTVRPETFFDRIGEFFGMDDIDFESAEFSRAFHVKAADRKWAFDVIHQDTMEFLLGAPRFQLEFGPSLVLAWRGEVVFAAVDFEAALLVANGVLDRLPAYLLREWKESSR